MTKRLTTFLTVTLLLLSASCWNISAQGLSVKGRVTDSYGDPLPGVGVVQKGTANGVITDIDGNYQIRLTDGNAVLEYSFLGMKTRQETVGTRSRIDVRMEDDAIGLQEVVAVGYGSMRREEITTAIASVKADEFIQGGVTSPLQLLQGKVAGLGMATTSGDPAAAPSISLRGISTLAASTSPLIVIDGIVGGALNSIAPEDIESIDVLKDGSAAAIYGTRGTNGVIIVNTKRPQAGQSSVVYDGYVKFDRMDGDHSRLDAAQWREKMADTDLPASITSVMQDYGGDSDWVGAITRNPVSQNHYLSASGANGRTSYVASAGYSGRQGIYKTSFDNSLALKAAINHSMYDDRLRVSLNIHDRQVAHGIVPDELYNNASQWNPTFPMYDENGDYYMTNNQTPICALNEWKGVNNYNQLSMSGKIAFEPIENLVLSVTGSGQLDYNEREWWGTHKTYGAIYGGENGSATLSGGHGDDRTLDLQADYSRNLGDHNLSGTVGYSWNRYVYQSWSMKAYDFPVDGFGAWNIGSGTSTREGLSTLSSNKHERKLIGFYGRLNYNYANRYLLMLSLRREGSDKFGANNRWGWFPAVSAGWRLTNEEFLKNVRWISELKLRAGFGITGTEPSASYQYLALYDFNNSYMSYVNGEWVSGIIPSTNPNPDLKWEEKRETNVGLDFAFLDSRIYGSVDAYYRHTRDLLYNYTVPTPPNISNSMLANVGSIMNAGVEVELNGDVIRRKDMTFSIGGNVSFNRNELLSLSNDIYTLEYLKLGQLEHVQTYSHRVDPKEPIGNFYAWKQLGLKGGGTAWRIEGAENATAGESEKQIVGNGMPKMFAAFHMDFRYKGFDASVSFHGAFKYQILNQYRMKYETLAWVQTYNVPAKAYEKIGDYYNMAPSTYCDYYIEDGDYLKLDNLTIGYTLKPKALDFVRSARIYLTGKNLLTFTGYTGMDPESVDITGLTPGIDALEKYPTLRSLTAGVSITF